MKIVVVDYNARKAQNARLAKTPPEFPLYWPAFKENFLSLCSAGPVYIPISPGW